MIWPGFTSWEQVVNWPPSYIDIMNAGTLGLIVAAILTVWARMYVRMVQAEAKAAALVAAAALKAEADLAATRIRDAAATARDGEPM